MTTLQREILREVSSLKKKLTKMQISIDALVTAKAYLSQMCDLPDDGLTKKEFNRNLKALSKGADKALGQIHQDCMFLEDSFEQLHIDLEDYSDDFYQKP